MSTASFEKTWQAVRTRLKVGILIPNWTTLKGYLGDTMKIEAVSLDQIVIDAPKAKNLQKVSKEDFEVIWQVWANYKSGKVKRSELIEYTRHSKYVISILHWFEVSDQDKNE